jgi:hypothetical protein
MLLSKNTIGERRVTATANPINEKRAAVALCDPQLDFQVFRTPAA